VAPFSLLIVFSSFIAFIRAQLIISPGVSIGDFITVRKLTANTVKLRPSSASPDDYRSLLGGLNCLRRLEARLLA
jgi:hypothetical protein